MGIVYLTCLEEMVQLNPLWGIELNPLSEVEPVLSQLRFISTRENLFSGSQSLNSVNSVQSYTSPFLFREFELKIKYHLNWVIFHPKLSHHHAGSRVKPPIKA